MNNKTLINIKDQNKNNSNPSSFLFNKNNDKLIIGTKQGSIYVYKINDDGYSIDQNYIYYYNIGQKNQQNWVRSLSISKNNKIAVGVRDSLIILSYGQDKLLIKQKDKQFPYLKTILCCCVGNLQNGSFIVYNVDNDTQIQIDKSNTYSLVFLSDGATLFQGAVGININVYQYTNGGTKPVLQGSIPASSSTNQIIIPNGDKFIGAQTLYNTVVVWKIISQQSKHQSPINNNLQLQMVNNGDNNLNYNQLIQISFIPLVNNSGSNLALSSDSNNIIIIPRNISFSFVERYILCIDEFYFENNDCISCNKNNCKSCFDQNTCISCQNSKYIDGDICISCDTKLDGCLECLDSSTCTKCDEDKNWKNQTQSGKCICSNQYYNKNHACLPCSQLLDCITCTDQDTCTLCKQQDNFKPQPSSGKCICKPQYYFKQLKCIQCQNSIAHCLKCTLDGKFCNQCNNDQNRQQSIDNTSCICKPYYYQDTNKQNNCTLCDQYKICIQCSSANPTNCIKCDISKGREQGPINGTCICKKQYFDNNNGTCVLCSDRINDCEECSQDGSVCKICKNQSNFNPTPQNGSCACNDGWILNQKLCQLCSVFLYGCKSCLDKNTCTSCDINNFFQQKPIQGKCICQKQYWLDNRTCSPCNSKISYCLSCSQTGQTCNQCQTDSNRQPNKAKDACVCKDYYYEDVADNKQCKLCDQHLSCIHCDKDKKCTLCDANKFWNSTPTADGKCKCQEGYNEVSGNCILCLVVGCQNCETQTSCSNCDQSKGFKPDPINNNTCECNDGKYKNITNKNCQLCNATMPGCNSCDNDHDCTSCDKQKHFIINTQNKCQCESKFYRKDNFTCQSCDIPVPHCNTCTVVYENKIQCDTCQKGYGINSNKQQCMDCSKISNGCIDCTDANKCTQCDQINHFVHDNQTNVCKCIDNYYFKVNKCQLCSQSIVGCINCKDQTFCLLCNETSHFKADPKNGKCICQDGKTQKDGICKSCQELIIGCVNCTDPITCIQCNANEHFQLTTDNKCQCNNKFYLNVDKCVQCNKVLPQCQTCDSNGKICNSCINPDDRQLNNDKTACICKDFKFEDVNNQCKLCDEYQICLHCSNTTNCLQCNTKNRWINPPTEGKCQCDSKYKQYNNVCYQCSVPGCTQCQGDNICIHCDQNKKFSPLPVQKQCVCRNGSHQQQDDKNECFDCNQKLIGCQQCDDLKQCKKCDQQNHYILNNQTNLCQCYNHYYYNQTTKTCNLCNQKIKYCDICSLNKDKEYQCNQCQKGFQPQDDNKSCLNCQDKVPGCIDCQNVDKCKQCDIKNYFILNKDTFKCDCINGYYLDNDKKKCVLCSDPIPGCISCDQTGKKCSQCDTIHSFVLKDNTCYCDKGFYLSDQHVCVFCSSKTPGCLQCNVIDGSDCSRCDQNQNFIYNNDTKKCDCIQGYFYIDNTCQLCQVNIPGCNKCSKDGKQCSSCNTDQHFVLNDKTKTCDCEQNYFLNKQTGKCILCSDYIPGCDKCSSEGDCLQCVGDHFVLNQQTKKCDCQAGFFVNTNKCDLCTQKLSGCANCSQNGGQCFNCDNTKHFKLDTVSNKCICQQRYFQKQKTCILCQAKLAGCTKCNFDGSQCLQCNQEHFVWDQNNKICVCQPHYYVSTQSKCTLCNQTITNCIGCKSSIKMLTDYTPSCQQCSNDFDVNYDGSKCQCVGDKQVNDQGDCVVKPSNNWYIYVIIGVGAVLVLGVAGYFIIKKCKKQRVSLTQQYQALDQQRNLSKNRKVQTILTDNNTRSNMSIKSSQYELND